MGSLGRSSAKGDEIQWEIQGVRKPSEHLTMQEELGKMPNSVEFSTKE
jgi:hypothetical protein